MTGNTRISRLMHPGDRVVVRRVCDSEHHTLGGKLPKPIGDVGTIVKRQDWDGYHVWRVTVDDESGYEMFADDELEVISG